jgi:hypothetical protein
MSVQFVAYSHDHLTDAHLAETHVRARMIALQTLVPVLHML